MRNREWIFWLSIAIMAVSVTITVVSIVAYRERVYWPEHDETEHYVLSEIDHPESEYGERKKIEKAVIASIGTDYEKECFGYSFTTLMEIITQEGIDYKQCHACATALHTAVVKCNGKYDPVQMAKIQRFEAAERYYTEAARRACIDVFVKGIYCEEVEDATVFHLESIGDTTYHDSDRCEYVITYKGIKFYRELRDWSVV